MKKNQKRRTVRLNLRLGPWMAFALRAYAKTYGRTISFAATEAIKSLIYDVPKSTKQKWLAEFRRLGNHAMD